MIVRPMIPADVGSIHAIHCPCLTWSQLGRYTREQIDAWMAGRMPEGWTASAGERFFVAADDGPAIGYASCQAAHLEPAT